MIHYPYSEHVSDIFRTILGHILALTDQKHVEYAHVIDAVEDWITEFQHLLRPLMVSKPLVKLCPRAMLLGHWRSSALPGTLLRITRTNMIETLLRITRTNTVQILVKIHKQE
jgi:hypothetical protein